MPGPDAAMPLALGEFLDLLPGERLQSGHQRLHFPLAGVIGQNQLPGSRPVDDVRNPVIHLPRAPPRDRHSAHSQPTPTFDPRQWFSAAVHSSSLLQRFRAVNSRHPTQQSATQLTSVVRRVQALISRRQMRVGGGSMAVEPLIIGDLQGGRLRWGMTPSLFGHASVPRLATWSNSPLVDDCGQVEKLWETPRAGRFVFWPIG
jgi:hypothetical protein